MFDRMVLLDQLSRNYSPDTLTIEWIKRELPKYSALDGSKRSQTNLQVNSLAATSCSKVSFIGSGSRFR